MPEAGADTKSPKTTRRLRPTSEHVAKSSTPGQVHFEEQRTSKNGNGGSAEAGNKNSGGNRDTVQPTSAPAIGPAPGSTVPGFPGGQWFTSADPSRSISQPAAFTAPQQASAFFPGPPGFAAPFSNYPRSQPPGVHQPVTYIGHHRNPLQQHPVHHASPIMASYSNAGPPLAGVNFQPPVPDSTFGPMPHVYVPRFDAGGAPIQGTQVGLSVSPVQFVPVAAALPSLEMPATAAAAFTVLVPKTYYLNGYTYHQPGSIPFGQQGYIVAPQPGLPPQYIAQQTQPVMINGQAYYPVQGPAPIGAGGHNFPSGGPPMMVQGVMNTPAAVSGVAPIMTGVANNAGPEVSGLGRTPNEEMARQVEFAYQNKLFEPQDFKPSDEDPSRFYYCREQDGNWTQRSRYTLDRMAVRWYVTDEGWFYAVRLPD